MPFGFFCYCETMIIQKVGLFLKPVTIAPPPSNVTFAESSNTAMNTPVPFKAVLKLMFKAVLVTNMSPLTCRFHHLSSLTKAQLVLAIHTW